MPEMTAHKFVFFLLTSSLMLSELQGQISTYPFVHEEIHHKPVFENPSLRVLNVSASKGDTTALHRHCHPILFITAKGATVSLREPQGEWVEAVLPTGWIGQEIYTPDTCYVHQFSVIGKKGLQIVAIEALSDSKPPLLSLEPAYREDGFTLFEIESSHLQEIASGSIPIILVENSDENQGKVEVVSSDHLTKKVMVQRSAYAVFFQKQTSTRGSE